MEKPTPAALDAFADVFPSDERAVNKKMFGMPAAFVNGNMFMGVFANGLIFRLPAERFSALCELDDIAPFEPMPGRPWKEYVHADTRTWGGTSELSAWAQEAFEHTAKMPPKAPKKKKS